jgi:hypothetical protein
VQKSSFLRSAAMAIMLAGAAFMPALSDRRPRVVPNMPGERLRNDPPKRPRKLSAHDGARLYDARFKREGRNLKRLDSQDRGGWASTNAWLTRLELRKAVANADAELNARYAAADFDEMLK